jgi:hypothetical protein
LGDGLHLAHEGLQRPRLLLHDLEERHHHALRVAAAPRVGGELTCQSEVESGEGRWGWRRGGLGGRFLVSVLVPVESLLHLLCHIYLKKAS